MPHTTSLTLLERLRTPGDQEARSRFARLYTPLLSYWCRRTGLQEHDAADLVQDVFVTLVRKLPEFQYDRGKSFRNWLRVLTLNKCRERNRRLALQPSGSALGVDEVADPTSDTDLDEAEYRRQLVHAALPIIEP